MRIAAFVACALMTVGIATAGNITLISTRAGIGATDSIDWSTQGTELDVKTGGSTVGSNAFTLSGASPLTLFSGSTYNADFQSTDTVLAAFDANLGAVLGAIRITFSSAIGSAGTQLQISDLGVPFTGTIEAFGAGDVSLGTVSISGLSDSNPSLGDGSAPFIGIQSSLVDILAIEFRTGNEGTAINNVSIGGAADLTATPEPGSVTLISCGILALFGLRRKLRG